MEEYEGSTILKIPSNSGSCLQPKRLAHRFHTGASHNPQPPLKSHPQSIGEYGNIPGQQNFLVSPRVSNPPEGCNVKHKCLG